MPVSYKISAANGLQYGVWHIIETVTELLQLVHLNEEEQNTLQSYKNEGRRLQWLAVRALLGTFLSPRPVIAYKENGKPYLPGRKEEISISHSGKMAAVAISTSIIPGIDIEEIHPKIHTIAGRFINEQEKSYLQEKTLTEQLCIIWAAKEVLYKIHPEGMLSFKNNLSVAPFTPSGKFQMQGTIKKDGLTTQHNLSCTRLNNYILVCTE